MAERMRRILVATDFSPIFESLVTIAAGLARQSGADLTLLHVFTHHEYAAVHAETGLAVDEYVHQLGSEMQYRVGRLQGIEVPVRYDAVEGRSTPERILAAAKALQVDLIVIGTHGRTGLRRTVLGSVAEEVLRHAHCPVLVVPLTVLDPQPTPAGYDGD